MRLPPFITTHTENVLRDILAFTSAADGTLSRYFRAHPKLGHRDRGVIAESVYSVLRQKSLFTHLSALAGNTSVRRLALLGLNDTVGAMSLGGLSPAEGEWLSQIAHIDPSPLPDVIRANLPSWLYETLVARNGPTATLSNACALNQPAPLDLRVNTIKSNREDVVQALTDAGIVSEPTPYSSLGVRLLKKPVLQNLPLFQQGWIEVQDEGSQLLTQIVGAKRGEMIVDFCAGAGGKTLGLGAAMRNTGRLYAFDISEKRLAKLKPRLARSGLSNVHPVFIAHENDTKVKRMAGKIDRVLVDAPCSGLGTIRRNPDVKWRQTAASVAEMNVKQLAILSSAQRLLKPGGRLVYGTCSFLEEENDAICEQFLATHPAFSLVPMHVVLAEQKIDLVMKDYLKLCPRLHHTDGFFAAVFVRQ